MRQKIFSLTLGIIAGLAIFFLVSIFFDLNSTVTKIKNNKFIQSTGSVKGLDGKSTPILDFSGTKGNYTGEINSSQSGIKYSSGNKILEIKKENRLNKS